MGTPGTALIAFPTDNLDFRILCALLSIQSECSLLLHALFQLTPLDTCRFILPQELLFLENPTDVFHHSHKISLFSLLKVHVLMSQTLFQ